MTLIQLATLIALLITTACSSQQKNDPFDNGRLEYLRRQSQVNESKKENERISRFVSVQKRQKKMSAQKAFPLPQVINEESLFREVLNLYQSRSSDGLNFMVGQFVKRYPTSIFADNAVYLQGQLELAKGDPTQALGFYEKTLKSYPTGNKYVAALFGKGVAYRKLRLFGYAENAFNEVKKKFPGSPEFYKVELEEKLLLAEKGS